ncbi:MAG: phasin family protein [Nitrospirae bacterium]|nr:phasin family protein [Nitrospirota bacterium]
MTVFDAVRKALLAGVAVQEKVKEFVDDLIKKGELSETEGAKLIKEWSQKADKTGKDLSKTISDLVEKTLDKINIPSREDVEKLQRKVQALSARVRKLEEAKGTESAPEE